MTTGQEQSGSASDTMSDAYQVDVVVALFAILLVLLLTGLARVQSEPVRESRSEYRPKDVRSQAFQLRSMAPTYPYRTVWIAKDDMLTRIDLRAVAARYLASGALQYEEWLPPVDLMVKPIDTVLDAFRMHLAFSGAGIPTELVTVQLPLNDAGAAADAVAVLGPGALIFVWEGQLSRLQPVLAQLREAGVCHKLHVEPNRQTVAIVRDYAAFLEHLVMRCY
jgi:hypothetical protein